MRGGGEESVCYKCDRSSSFYFTLFSVYAHNSGSEALHFLNFKIIIFVGLDTSQENALREMEDLEVLSATGKIVIH